MALAERFVDESLALHWKVDETPESFQRLLYHIEVKTNFKRFFQEAFQQFKLSHSQFFQTRITIADLGAGVGWTSAILANQPDVKHVYTIDPSRSRLDRAKFVAGHFKVPNEKISFIQGSFAEPKLTKKVDLILLCAAIHHCCDEDMADCFANMKNLLSDKGVILIANDHYVTFPWSIMRLLSFLKNFKLHSGKIFSPAKLRAPDPFSGEHWRIKKELETIFFRHGMRPEFFINRGDLCKDKTRFYQKWGFRYYYAFLTKQS